MTISRITGSTGARRLGALVLGAALLATGLPGAGIPLPGWLPGGVKEAAAQTRQTPFRPIAIVNDEAITGYDLQQRMLILSLLGLRTASEEALQRAAIDALIEDRLKLQEGKRLGLSATEEAVTRTREAISARLNVRPDELSALVSAQEIGPLAFEDFVNAEAVWGLVVRTRFARRLEPGEAEIQAELDLLTGQQLVSYRIREIGLPNAENNRGPDATRALGQRIAAELNAGGDFAAAVQRYSRSPSRQRGGEVGWVPARNLPPDLAAELAELEPGQVSQPLPVQGGFSIVQLVETRREQRGNVDTKDPELREQVRRALITEQSNRLAEGLLQELRRDALIDFR